METASYAQEDPMPEDPIQEDPTSATGEWLCFRGNPAHTGKTSLPGPPEEMEMKWRWKVGNLSLDPPISASPAVTSDGTVYIATESGYIAAIKPEGGTSWIYKLDGPAKASPAVDSEGNVLTITEEGYIYYLDSRGELQWKCDFDIDIVSSPVINGGTAYVGTNNNSLIALNLTPDMPGIEIESKKVLTSDVLQWSFATDGNVKLSPAFAGNTVFVAGKKYLYALNSTAGGEGDNSSAVKWQYDFHDDITTSAAVYGGRVYIGTASGYLYAFNENVSEEAKDADYIWRRKISAPITSSPAIDETEDGEVLIYFGADDGRLYAYNKNGEPQWNFPSFGSIRSSPAVDNNGDIYFGSDDGFVYALFQGGSLKWKFPDVSGIREDMEFPVGPEDLENLKWLGMVHSSPAIGDKRLYVGSNIGYLYCIGESDESDREVDMQIGLPILVELENDSSNVTVEAEVTSEADEFVLSLIAYVTLDLSLLNLEDESGNRVKNVVMLDDGGDKPDKTSGDGVFTFEFGITLDQDKAGYNSTSGAFSYYVSEENFFVGPVPIMVSVQDVYGHMTSGFQVLNVVKIDKDVINQNDNNPEKIEIKNLLNNQKLSILFESRSSEEPPSIIQVIPDKGTAGSSEDIAIEGKNTNFIQDKTFVVVCNDDNKRVAFAAADPNVTVLGRTTLTAALNIESAANEGVTGGPWDLKVVTPLEEGGCPDLDDVCEENSSETCEIAVKEDAFTISASSTRVVEKFQDLIFRLSDKIQTTCRFKIEINNEEDVFADGSPWVVSTGTKREITVEEADAGIWDFNFSLDNCSTDEEFIYTITTKGSNFGFLTGEVRNGLTGEGIDNVAITALTGEGIEANDDTEGNTAFSSGGGYYMLPLAAANGNYMVVAGKDGFFSDIEREVIINDNGEEVLNFSLMPEIQCPISGLAGEGRIAPFYQFRDSVLKKTAQGQRWTALYYKHAREVRNIILTSPPLKEKSRRFIFRVLQELPDMMKGGTIECDLRTDAAQLIDSLAEKGSFGLKNSLRAERENILDFLSSNFLSSNDNIER